MVCTGQSYLFNHYSKIGSLISDWSGTISDDRLPVYTANMKLLDYFDKPRIGMKKFLSDSTMTAVQFLRKHGVSHLQDEQLFNKYKEFYENEVSSGNAPKPYSDVRGTLEALYERGLKLSVLSSHPEDSLKKEAEKYGITRYFHAIRGNSRNKAEDLKEMSRSIGGKTLYVDDTIWGVRAAKDALVKSAGITTGYHSLKMLKKERPDYILNRFSDLKIIL